MVELLGIVGVLIVGGIVIGVTVMLIKLIALAFKLALLPIKIAFKLLFGVIAGGILLLVLGPVAVVLILALAIPVLIIGGLVWGAVALVT
jgi:hypothetical protein